MPKKMDPLNRKMYGAVTAMLGIRVAFPASSALKRYMFVLSLLAGAPAYGQSPAPGVPRLVPFNGVVKDRSGKALNGTVGLTMSSTGQRGAPSCSPREMPVPNSRS